SKDGAFLIVQGRNVGGGTTVNWCSTFRTPSQTLEHWREYYGLKQCSESVMSPHFEAMEKRLKVSKWIAPHNLNNEILKRGAESLGYSWDIIPRNVSACWNLGYCGVGCPVDAKQSMLVTTIPAALNSGSTLVHRASIEKLIHNGDTVSGVEGYALSADGIERTGQRITVRAKHTVLAGGAMNTPALLLRSKVPDPHNRIGTRTFLHPVTVSFAQFDEQIDPYYGAPQSIYSDQFTWEHGVTGPAGYKLEVIPLLPGTFSAILGGHGDSLLKGMQNLSHTQGMMSFLRDGFHPESTGGTVTLGAGGSPVLDYPINSYLQDGFKRSLNSMMQLQFAAGAKSVRPSHSNARWYDSPESAQEAIKQLSLTAGKIGLSSAHVMGGCAMGEDEKFCVADSEGRYRYLNNLSVFDGSLFPTSLGTNPQMTIFAFVRKFALQLSAALRSD
ncbi:MAG: GMC family oxidoreductase N-terminal domain-containing protein, partial [Pseudomonadota bacterium]